MAFLWFGLLIFLAAAKAVQTTFFIRQPHAHELRSALERVSDPTSPDWGSFLTHAEVLSLQAPQPGHAALIKEHALRLGATDLRWSLAGDKLMTELPSSSASSLLPPSLEHALDFVAHSVHVRNPRETRSRSAKKSLSSLAANNPLSKPAASDDPQGCLFDRAIPPCLRKAYGINDTHATASGFNAQAVVVNQGFKPSDLAAFEKQHGLPAQPVAKTVGTNSGEAGDEATLDIEFIIAMGSQVPTWWVYINGHTANPFASWITWASNTSHLPHVHSLSVGEPEDGFARDNGGLPAIARMNDEMAALGARGVSLVFASGDSGFVEAQKYPASSPYVTAVGGVTWGPIFRAPHLEVDGETTGGFSSLPPNEAPNYQSAFVQHFLTQTSGTRPRSNLNASRRCVPDLAAYSTEYYIVQDGSDTVIGGTSAATPVVAGMLSLINDALIAKGHAPLGFANPFLYANADAFLDVTHGGNGGYDAVPGYDPASGLGTFSTTTFSILRERAIAGRERLRERRQAAAALVVEVAGPLPEVERRSGGRPQISCSAGGEGEGRLYVGLRHTAPQREALEAAFWMVAEPSSSEYRRHRTVEQLKRLVAADDATVRRAKAWLRSLGADLSDARLTATADALEVPWPCAGAADVAPIVPPALTPTIEYAVLLKPRHTDAASGSPPATHQKLTASGRDAGSTFGPRAQKAAYGVPASLSGSNAKNWQMVWGTGSFGYRVDDLSLFFSTYASSSSVKDVSLDTHSPWHGSTGGNFVEGTLDASYIAAFAPGVKTVVANNNISAATENGEAFGPALLAFLVSLNGRDQVPNVLSMSLGSLSFGSCDKMCKALAAKGGHSYKACWDYLQDQHQACMFGSADLESRIDAEFIKLGLRGVTITAASGDGGSHFAFGPFSGSLGGALDAIICSSMHMPVYPAASPYVLSIGGTEWSSDDMYGPTCHPTKPCGWESGGGGFSWATAAPAYQANVTAAYISKAAKVAPKTSPKPSTFNGGGRGYPDLSALAQFGIPLCTYGGCSGSGGTSASAPTVAGMLSLINDARLNAGKPPLGFINTRLYQLMADPQVYAECFTDVGIDKLGYLWDCPTYSTCTGCEQGGDGPGFVATSGWDAQTGFGQPLFPGLLKHLSAD